MAQHTLDEFHINGDPYCGHCARGYPLNAKVELFTASDGVYALVECPRCHCSTPFKTEATA